jgi:hypothetical protein
MSMYKIYNGTSWVDICKCALHVLDANNSWQLIDPNNCEVKYFDGKQWCTIRCKQPCLDFLEAGECDSIPASIPFNSFVCNNLFGVGVGCAQLVAYIPIKLTNMQQGFTCSFIPSTIYDGLDVVDVCNETVLGGLGMLGSSMNSSTQVTPGIYNYSKKVFYNFATSQFELLTSFPDFQMEFKYPSNCINDWDTSQTIGTTTGYENLVSQGDPLPTINEMYLPRILDGNGDDICALPLNNTGEVSFVFNRPPAPIGGYPLEEIFLLRAFSHPVQSGTIFTINNLTCF